MPEGVFVNVGIIRIVILRSNATKNLNDERKILRLLHSLRMTVVEVYK